LNFGIADTFVSDPTGRGGGPSTDTLVQLNVACRVWCSSERRLDHFDAHPLTAGRRGPDREGQVDAGK
jgi:hypothetical protein